VIGSTEILDVDHIEYITRDSGKKTEFRPYYRVKCTNCGHEHVKLYNKTNWLNYKGCIKCKASFEDPKLNRIKNYYKTN
jgi:predicted Zn-ribbon and HTH transcriptional regulator